MNGAGRIRVLFVDDSLELTELYRRLIGRSDDLELAGVMESAEGLTGRVESLRPDVVVMDLTMPGPDPLEAMRLHCASGGARRECRFIAFSGRDDEGARRGAIEAGACSLISKDDHPTRLLEEIRRVVRA